MTAGLSCWFLGSIIQLAGSIGRSHLSSWSSVSQSLISRKLSNKPKDVAPAFVQNYGERTCGYSMLVRCQCGMAQVTVSMYTGAPKPSVMCCLSGPVRRFFAGHGWASHQQDLYGCPMVSKGFILGPQHPRVLEDKEAICKVVLCKTFQNVSMFQCFFSQMSSTVSWWMIYLFSHRSTMANYGEQLRNSVFF